MGQVHALAGYCKGCRQQLGIYIPLRGPLAVPLRVFGIRRSRMNPNLCTVCELMFTTVNRRRQIEDDLTILFADLRGYTALTQALEPAQMSRILNLFYDASAGAIWDHDGLLNKTIGDAVMAVFNFPIKTPEHVRNAVLAALEIQRRCHEGCREIASACGIEPEALAVGVGIHTGMTAFGEFGSTHVDLTAIGNVVNLASRLQAAAAPGEILVSDEVARAAGELASRGSRTCELKGFAAPVVAHVY